MLLLAHSGRLAASLSRLGTVVLGVTIAVLGGVVARRLLLARVVAGGIIAGALHLWVLTDLLALLASSPWGVVARQLQRGPGVAGGARRLLLARVVVAGGPGVAVVARRLLLARVVVAGGIVAAVVARQLQRGPGVAVGARRLLLARVVVAGGPGVAVVARRLLL